MSDVPSNIVEDVFMSILAGYTLYFSISFILFLICIDIQPIKGRFPLGSILSAIGGYIIIFGVCSSYILNMVDWSCLQSFSIIWVGYPLFFLPYILRAWRLASIFRAYEALRLSSSLNHADQSLVVNKRRSLNATLLTAPMLQRKSKRFKTLPKSRSSYYTCKCWKHEIEFDPPTLISLLSFLSCVCIGMYRLFNAVQSSSFLSSGCPIHQTTTHIILLLTFIILIIAAMIGLWYFKVRDEFNMILELRIVSFFFILTFIALITAREKSLLESEIYLCLIDLCYILCPMIGYTVTTVWPVTVILLRGINHMRVESESEIKETLGTSTNILLSLKSALENEECRKCFKEFVQLEFNSENLLFYLDVENFRQEDQGDTDQCYNKAEYLYDTYLHPDAKLPIHISEKEQRSIEAALVQRRVKCDIFDNGQKEVFVAMENGSFKRFQLSKKYEDLKQSLECKAALYNTMYTSSKSHINIEEFYKEEV